MIRCVLTFGAVATLFGLGYLAAPCAFAASTCSEAKAECIKICNDNVWAVSCNKICGDRFK
ncbi:MAG: hypothetical protein ACR2PO_15250, partial [Methyloligellaceae bacterium]